MFKINDYNAELEELGISSKFYYIDIKPGTVSETIERTLSKNLTILIDLDKDNEVLGIEIISGFMDKY